MPPVLDIVDDHILRFFPDLVRDLGGDPDDFLRAAGVDPRTFHAGAFATTYPLMVELVGHAAARLRCADFGMQLASRQAGHIRSPLLALMENCATVGEALQQASAHSNAHSLAAAIWLDLSEEDGRVLVGHDILLSGLPERAQAMEQILLTAHHSIRAVSQGRIRTRQVRFRHQPVSEPRVYRRYFGCEVVFGREHDALVFERGDLALPTSQADRGAFEAAVAWIESKNFPRSPFHARVRAVVMRELGGDRCNNGAVSDALGMHLRAMHRRLGAEGTSFQKIKTEVRREFAVFYLEQTDLDLNGISRHLGFAEQSALAYFCQKWLAASPSAIRRRARQRMRIAVGLSETNKSDSLGSGSGPVRDV
jgi:AraC-like DNA-binding protein